MDIRIKDLLKTYGEVVAVNISALHVQPGRIFGLVGENGAGKTTFLRQLLDLVEADRGCVLVNGVNIAKEPDWKQNTGSYLDKSFLFPFLSPREYFQFIGKLYGFSPVEIEDSLRAYREFFNVDEESGERLIRDLSSGNKQKVGLLGTLIIKPKLLILDEPFASLDPLGQQQLKGYLEYLRSEFGTTVVLSSHNLHHVKDVCDRIVILKQGRLIEDIDPRKVPLEDLYKYFRPAGSDSSPV
ncbi:MAG: ATP-binding cassette domain-containing protein [Candidatus Marinimicrobia bacterium]|nr:ATP-binding cassette domain-containing protein [Candidatus Neomarinimicrobiota bacterium]